LRFNEYWIGPAQLALTAALARSARDIPGEAVEVGTWQGLSAIPIARAVAPASLHVVDHWQGDVTEAGSIGIDPALIDRDNYGIFLSNLHDARITNVEIHRMGWREFIAGWDRPLRFVHIDASHTEDEVAENIGAFLPYASEGAVFCGDDYGFPQVAAGVHRVFPAVNSSENKLWWKVIGDDSETFAWPPHYHPLSSSHAYQSDLMDIREMYVLK
jgi:hypothetical protein